MSRLDQVREIVKVAFDAIDINKDGQINTRELQEAWEKAGRSLGEAMCTFQRTDTNGDGSISWDEFFSSFIEDELEADTLEEAEGAVDAMEEGEWTEFFDATQKSLESFR